MQSLALAANPQCAEPRTRTQDLLTDDVGGELIADAWARAGVVIPPDYLAPRCYRKPARRARLTVPPTVVVSTASGRADLYVSRGKNKRDEASSQQCEIYARRLDVRPCCSRPGARAARSTKVADRAAGWAGDFRRRQWHRTWFAKRYVDDIAGDERSLIDSL
jgi:hypothetical protein